MRTNVIWGLLLAGLASMSQPAFADGAASTAEAEKSWAEKHLKANYVMWLQQMHTEALSGNRAGGGTNLLNEHFFSLGTKLNDKMTLKATVYGDHTIDNDDTTRSFEVGDIYFTLSHSSLFKVDSQNFNLDGYVRVYLPTSANTINALNRGTTSDAGHGKMRLLLNPVKSFMDGKFSLSGLTYMNFYFNSMSPTERFDRGTRQRALEVAQTGAGATKPSSFRHDMYFVFDPSLTYTISPKLETYIEWTTGVLRHFTDGVVTESGVTHPVSSRWSSINNVDEGMELDYGFNWYPTKKVSVNPYLHWQLSAVHDTDVASVKRRVGLFAADIGLQLTYVFL